MPNDPRPSAIDPRKDERSLFSDSFCLSGTPAHRTRTSPAFFAPPGTWLLGIVHIRCLLPDTVLWMDFHASPNRQFWVVQALVHACSPGKWLVSLPPTRFPWLRVTFRTDPEDRAMGDLNLLALPGDLGEPLRPPLRSDEGWPASRLIAAPFLDAESRPDVTVPTIAASVVVPASSDRSALAAAPTSSSDPSGASLNPDSCPQPFLTPHNSLLTPSLALGRFEPTTPSVERAFATKGDSR